MKKVIKIFMSSCLSILFLACDNIDKVEQVNHQDKEALEYIERLGFKIDSYKKIELKNEKYFLIEKDVLFNIKKLIKNRDKQWSISEEPVSKSKVSSMTWEVGSSIPSAWKIAMINASNEWSNIDNCLINIKIETLSTASPDIILDEFDLVAALGSDFSDIVAIAEYPIDGKPGERIFINSGYHTKLTPAKKKYTLAHELGHTFGFRHTNWFDRNNDGYTGTFGDGSDSDDEGWCLDGISNAYHILGTSPLLDENSIMNDTVMSWTEFSDYDEDAAKALYFHQGALNKVTIKSIGLFGTGKVGSVMRIRLKHENMLGTIFKYSYFTRMKNPINATDAFWYSHGSKELTDSITPTTSGDFEFGVVVRNSLGRIVSIAKKDYTVRP